MPLMLLLLAACAPQVAELEAAHAELAAQHAELQARVAELEASLEASDPPRRPGRGAPDLDRIESLGEGRWRIPPDVRDAMLAQEEAWLYRQGRFFPYLDGDRYAGMVLRLVHRRTALDRLGLRSGDIVRRVNDRPLEAAGFPLLMHELQAAERIEVALTRDGEPQTLVWEVR